MPLATERWQLHEAACEYVKRDWTIFPVVKNQKVPRIENWQEGTTDTNLWKRWSPNIGIVTGKPSGIVVLDIDNKSGGWESLKKLQDKYGDLPDTMGVYTANLGYHFYFAAPGVEVRNGARILGYPGIDIRGDGGYVVAPPSVVDGRPYRWDPESPADLAPLPEFLIQRERPAAVAVSESEYFPEGTRNDSLARLGGSLRRFGLSYGIIEATLLEANEEKCNPPLPVEEVKNIAKSVTRYEPSFRPGGGASGPSGDSGDQRGRPNETGLPQGRPLYRAGAPSRIRSGAWYLGKRR